MAGSSLFSFPTRSLKHQTWRKCSMHIREQKARLYIIWRCAVLLVCWQD
uniref:DEVIL-like protein n=1 Tax=Kalanchoe fedtschenkoi TaxID=63787 RepID=A0A7N0SYD2_KALFE